MDVYLVPVGADRYEPYCEVPEDPEEDAVAGEERGFFRRLVDRFKGLIADAERERRQGAPMAVERGWFGRLRARTLRWVAESIAEQKLLWHLRKQDAACLHYPDDMSQENAEAILRRHLTQDADKHRRWMIIDGVAFLLSFVLLGPLFLLIPGVANLPAFYFGFRLVGHYLSRLGATRGLRVVAWRHSPSAPLAELRGLLTLDPEAREPRVHAVAEMLRLEHLASFFERSAVST